MVNIDYHIHPSSIKKAKSANLKIADPMTLHYDHFLGDILLKVNDYDLDADWGWVPVLDFAICMKKIITSLEENEPQVFEFTESDAHIKMSREVDKVILSVNYDPNLPEIPVAYSELEDAIAHFYRGLIAYLTSEFPDIKENSYLQSIK